jgi:hypothetical protein
MVYLVGPGGLEPWLLVPVIALVVRVFLQALERRKQLSFLIDSFPA